MHRSDAEALDRSDPLAWARERFGPFPPRPVYLDGNSLGRPPAAMAAVLERAVADWRDNLVEAWDRWIDLPASVGDRLGRLIGAAAGQILICDSTTVNLYKLVAAALAARPGRDQVVGMAGDFPTDRYVLQSLARAGSRRLQLIGVPEDDDPDRPGLEGEIEAALDRDTALVCLSHVDFRSGRRIDAARITAAAHEVGALVLWDLAHSAGVVPVDLDGWGADLAVGCTYKYLNSGPGAPAFLYVTADIQDELEQPIWGWFGQADQFGMGERYRPAAGVGSYLTGTPGLVGLRAVEAALAVTEEAGERSGTNTVWAKSQRLTGLLTDVVLDRLVPLGATLASPRRPDLRGGHVSVSHPQAWPWCRTLIDRRLVVGDFRPPDMIRLGPAPLYTTFAECHDAVDAMAETLASGLDPALPTRRVT